MEKRDYVESMIEQMGLFLQKLLTNLIQDIGTENSAKTINSIEELFKNEFNISMDALVRLNENEFKNFVIKRNFKETHLENLAALLYQIALQKVKNEKGTKNLNEKAIQLLELADFVSNSYSVDRLYKKNEILNSKF